MGENCSCTANERNHSRKYTEKAEARVWRKGRGVWAITMKPVFQSFYRTVLILLAQYAKSLKSPHFPSYPPALWSAPWKFWLQRERVVNKRTGEGPREIFSSLALFKANKDLLKHRGKKIALNKIYVWLPFIQWSLTTFYIHINTFIFCKCKQVKVGTKQQTAVTSPDAHPVL